MLSESKKYKALIVNALNLKNLSKPIKINQKKVIFKGVQR